MAQKFKDMRDVAFIGAMGRALAVGGTNKSKLAKRINASRTTISNWHENPSMITLGNLRILVRELHLTDDEVLKIVK